MKRVHFMDHVICSIRGVIDALLTTLSQLNVQSPSFNIIYLQIYVFECCYMHTYLYKKEMHLYTLIVQRLKCARNTYPIKLIGCQNTYISTNP